MQIVNLNQAKTHLSQLVQQALAGKQILIAKRGQPLVGLTPIEVDTSPRVGGQWAGKVTLPSDAELAALDKEIEASFEASTIFPTGDA